MLKLQDVRDIYPVYSDMTDYELSTAIHRTKYPDVPYEGRGKQNEGLAAGEQAYHEDAHG